MKNTEQKNALVLEYEGMIENAQTVGELLLLGGKIWTHSPDELTNAEQVNLDLKRRRKIDELHRAEPREKRRERLWTRLADVLSESDIDLENGMTPDELDGITDADDLFNDFAERYINENSDVIYYSRAIKYLEENDPSLARAFELAEEFGYNLKDLDSEKLASLLSYDENVKTYRGNRNEIDDILEERQETIEEETDED